IAGKASVARKTDRPDFGFLADRVIEPAAVIGHGPDAAFVLRVTPGSRVFAIEGGGLDVHHGAVVGDRGQPMRRTPGNAMVEAVDQIAVEVYAMDQTGVEIRGERLAVGGIEGEAADGGRAAGGGAGRC